MLSRLSVSFRSLVLPKEHGGWSLAFEPVVLGLLVAPSRPGLVLTFAVIAGFFVRRPLKLAITLPADDCRRRPASRWAALWSALVLLGMGGAIMLGSWTALWPLLLCVPFGAIFLWFDLRNDMREAEAELAGSAVFALIPATLATLAGWNAPTALGLAGLMLTRNLPTVLTMRTYLRRAKGLPTHSAAAFASAGVAFMVVVALGWSGIAPATVGLLAAGMFVRSIIFLTSLRPIWPAKRIGMFEAAIGGLYLACLALAYHFD